MTDTATANVEVYDALAGSYRAGRDTYLPVMRDEMESFVARLHVIGAGHMLDVGSGAGVHAQILSEAGFDVTCIDAAANMLQVVRDHVPSARCQVADFWQYKPPHAFDGVVLASFVHLFPKALFPRIMSRVGSWMRPGAVGWIATVVGEPREWAPVPKEGNHGHRERWRVTYGDEEIRGLLAESGLELLEVITAPDGIHADKIWKDYIVRFPGRRA